MELKASKFDYDGSHIADCYDKARDLPLETRQLWAKELRLACPGSTPAAPVVIDLGAGTGRFVPILVEAFNAAVVAVDPSSEMLSKTPCRPGVPVTIAQGRAESIPCPTNSANVVFLSMAIHHIDDWPKALSELNRVLAPHGRVVIRNSFAEDVAAFAWSRFFPEAAVLEQQRLPSLSATLARFRAAGWLPISIRTVRQRFAESADDYVGKISLRGLSCLRLIPDQAFAAGVERLRRAKGSLSEAELFEDIQLVCFEKPAL